jgi:hypothetical protein
MQGTITSDKMIRRQRMEDFIALIEIEKPGLFEVMMREAVKRLKNTECFMAFITPIKDVQKRKKRINLWARSFLMPDLIREKHKDTVENGKYVFSDEQDKILEEITKIKKEKEVNNEI